MSATQTTSPASTGDAVERQLPAAGSVVIVTASEGVRRAVDGIGEAEVGGGEGVGRVLVGRDRVVGAGRRVVDRGDVDGDRVGALVEVDAAVGGAAVVLHLEGEAGVGRAVGVGGRA